MGYGNCHLHDLTVKRIDDPDIPPTSDGYFYLVTAANSLAEEGINYFRVEATLSEKASQQLSPGMEGIGKRTCARLFAMALNCDGATDSTEIHRPCTHP